jgi:hypothetical protein
MMIDLLNSPYIVPLGAFAVAIAAVGFGGWRKVREAELRHATEMRLKEMEHEVRIKELELEKARLQ